MRIPCLRDHCLSHPGSPRFTTLAAFLAAGLAVALGFAAARAHAQEGPLTSSESPALLRPEYAIDFWRETEDLPGNTVNALLQTGDGYLWVGTSAGLARFDGMQFTALGDDTAPGLAEAPISSLLEDRNGALWVGTQGRGVFRLHQGEALRFTVTDGLSHEVVTSLAEDASGRVWIGTQNGLDFWRKDRPVRFYSPAMKPGDSIVALHAGRSGKVWVTTRSGVFHITGEVASRFDSEDLPAGRNAEFIGAYEDSTGNLWAFGTTFLLNATQGRRFNYFRAQELASSRLWTVCEQADGTFWIGTSGRGLFRFQTGRFRVVGAAEGLEQCDVRALYADRLGNLWIGTSGNGLARLRTPKLAFVSAGPAPAPHKVSAVAADPAGGVWVGTEDAGVLRWDGTQLKPITGYAGLERLTQIQSLCVDGPGTVWIGTWGAGLWQARAGRVRQFTTADGLADNVVLAVCADDETATVWATTRSGKLHRIQGDRLELVSGQERQNSPILSLLSRPDGGLLCGTTSGAILRWNGAALDWVATPQGLAGHPVRCLWSDLKGRLWIGSWGAGAFCLRGTEWIKLGGPEGLPSAFVGQIAQDAAGDYWFATADNLYLVRQRELEGFLSGKISRVASVSGMVEEAGNAFKCATGWPGLARDTNGVSWLATSRGLLPLAPGAKTPAEPAPPVIIERVLVDGESRRVGENGVLRLGAGVRSLDFVFTAISFNSPDKIRFRHKLENFETDWVDGETVRRTHYGPLPPGQYTFRVLACNADGVWNSTGASQALVVVPPIWKAWWFLGLCGTAATVTIWRTARAISTRRLRARLRAAEQEHAMERERARIAQDMHDEIGSKLTRISFLSEIARQSSGNSAGGTPPVEAIATTSREVLQALDEIVWAVNPRNDNLEHLAGYLEQHAREYFQATEVDCQIQVPAELPPVGLSAEVRHNVFLAFEEALNNTLKHAKSSRVHIAMRLDADSFEIRVEDDGEGFATGQRGTSGQDGLQNMQDRLKSVGGSCEVTSQPGAGTVVRLRFPLNQSKTPKRALSDFM